jgi:hypothetical protein
VPLIVTKAPVIPEAGVNELTVGRPYAYRSFDDVALVPWAVFTVTFTTPEACAGATAFKRVADTNVTDPDAVEPNFTLAPDTKLAPLIVTVFPPAVEPAFRATLLTAAKAPPPYVTVTSPSPRLTPPWIETLVAAAAAKLLPPPPPPPPAPSYPLEPPPPPK